MRVVYIEPDQRDAPPPPFRSGAGGHVWLAESGALETDERVQLSANTVHALEGHGVLEALNRLPLEMGRLGSGEPVTRVALDLGYDSVSAFSAMFRRATGASPSAYRHRAKNA